MHPFLGGFLFWELELSDRFPPISVYPKEWKVAAVCIVDLRMRLPSVNSLYPVLHQLCKEKILPNPSKQLELFVFSYCLLFLR